MSTASPTPSENGTPPKAAAAGPAVIRRIQSAEETPHDRLMKKHVPAWVISGAIHVALMSMMILIFRGGGGDMAASETIIQTTVEEEKVEDPKDLTNPDIGLDSNLESSLPLERELDVNVEAKVTDDPVGVPTTDNTQTQDAFAPPGVGADLTTPGVTGDAGQAMMGTGGAMGSQLAAGFAGRSGATKNKLLQAGGGNDKSEAAVARGLIWLSKQQKADGHWAYDGSNKGDTACATAHSLLPFFAAAQTHKSGKYIKTCKTGLEYVLRSQRADGGFNTCSNMYAQGICTLALAEAYGMTADKAMLMYPLQRAVNFLSQAQGPDGSWGYSPKTNGDTSIVGWQIQALKSAKMCKDIVVDDNVFKRAGAFLDKVSGGSKKSTYGYREGPGRAGTSLTSVGLLCRYYMDGWGPQHPGMAEGVQGLLKVWPPSKNKFDMYYYYYATQVVHFFDGDEWRKQWNPSMRDMLFDMQVGGKGPNLDGSWDPDRAMMGSHTGRLGTTVMCLLTLEVYYRHLPLYKRDTGGLRELERAK